MRSGFLRSVVAIGLCLALAGPAAAREVLAVGSRFPQVFERGAGGEYAGLACAVLRQALEPLGHQVRFELHPWARAQRMVELGQADILIGPYKTPAREARFVFSARPFYRDRVVFYSRADRRFEWTGDYRQLRARRIGVVRAWSYGPRFEVLGGQLERVTVEAVENGVKMLSVGRLDLLASNQRNTRPVLQVLGLGNEIVQLDTQIDVQDGYFAFPHLSSHRQLREDFDRAFRQMLERGQLAQLAGQWQVEAP
ncbi:transporter substrate-binding domain-containing protein [Pseudomonas sp. CrR25]|nr:transporter substrate-binding domain-containing protein [Pseudomonas sp. CrR25]